VVALELELVPAILLLAMLCSLATTVGEGERDAVKYGGAVETEWRCGRWRFLSLAAPLS
jgi:hypothetical protein